jgi:ribosomal protein L11 methylase PrmA
MSHKESAADAIQGSFRDPAGQVYQLQNKIFRTITAHGSEALAILKESNFIKDLVNNHRLVPFLDAPLDILGDAVPLKEVVAIIEHERLNFISHPYEWTFSALQSAALCHLDIQLDALEHNVSLVDASAYNIQFQGANPIFIDHLSFRSYQEGALWEGHRQFCEQFLNPLLLQAKRGLPFNEWYRGSMDGISGTKLAPLLPKRSYLSFRMLTHVILPTFFEKRLLKQPNTNAAQLLKTGKLPKSAFRSMLLGLRKWINSLEPKNSGPTQWNDYQSDNSYSDSEAKIKGHFIADFASKVRPKTLWDLGCNTGFYASLALQNGAKNVVGFDADHMALEQAFKRAQNENLNFLPLHQDFANPSSDQGWKQQERMGLNARRNADGVLAVALIHHLAIRNNIPLCDALSWIVKCAPTGVIEFVPKSDPMVKKMLQHRKDIFDDYSEENFLIMMTSLAKIIHSKHISEDGRLLVWYSREI